MTQRRQRELYIKTRSFSTKHECAIKLSTKETTAYLTLLNSIPITASISGNSGNKVRTRKEKKNYRRIVTWLRFSQPKNYKYTKEIVGFLLTNVEIIN